MGDSAPCDYIIILHTCPLKLLFFFRLRTFARGLYTLNLARAAARLAGELSLAQASALNPTHRTDGAFPPIPVPTLSFEPSIQSINRSCPSLTQEDNMAEVSSTRLYLGNLPRNGEFHATRRGKAASLRAAPTTPTTTRPPLTLAPVSSYQGRCRGSLRDPWHR